MRVGSFEGRLVNRVVTLGHVLGFEKSDIKQGWDRAQEVASAISTKDVWDIKVSVNRQRLFPDIGSYGACLEALTKRIVTRNKSVHNTLNEASREMLVQPPSDAELAMPGLFTFIPILRKEELNCPVQTAANDFKPDEQAVSTWDCLLFLLSDPARQKTCTFVATEDLLTESHPGEYRFSPALVHKNTEISIIKVPRDAPPNGKILNQLVRSKRTY